MRKSTGWKIVSECRTSIVAELAILFAGKPKSTGWSGSCVCKEQSVTTGPSKSLPKEAAGITYPLGQLNQT